MASFEVHISVTISLRASYLGYFHGRLKRFAQIEKTFANIPSARDLEDGTASLPALGTSLRSHSRLARIESVKRTPLMAAASRGLA